MINHDKSLPGQPPTESDVPSCASHTDPKDAIARHVQPNMNCILEKDNEKSLEKSKRQTAATQILMDIHEVIRRFPDGVPPKSSKEN